MRGYAWGPSQEDVASSATPFGHALYHVYVDYCRLPALAGSARSITPVTQGFEPKMTLQQLNSVAHDLKLLAPYGRLTPSQLSNIYMSYKPVGSSHLTFGTFLQALAAIASIVEVSPDELYAAVQQLGSEAAGGTQRHVSVPITPPRSMSARPAATHEHTLDPSSGLPKHKGSRFQGFAPQNSQSAPIPASVAREAATASPATFKASPSPYLNKPQRSVGAPGPSQPQPNMTRRQSLESQSSASSREQPAMQVTANLHHLSPRVPGADTAVSSSHHTGGKSRSRPAGGQPEEGVPDWVQHMMGRLWALEHRITAGQASVQDASISGRSSAAAHPGLRPRDSEGDKQLPKQDSTSLPPPPSLSLIAKSAPSTYVSQTSHPISPDWALQVMEQLQAMQATCDKAVRIAEASQAEVADLCQQVKTSSAAQPSVHEDVARVIADLEVRQAALEVRVKPDIQSQLDVMQTNMIKMRDELDQRIANATASCNTLSAQLATVASQMASTALHSSSRPTSAVSARRSGTNAEPGAATQLSQHAMKLASEAAAGVEILAAQVKALASAQPATSVQQPSADSTQDDLQRQLQQVTSRLEQLEQSRGVSEDKLSVTSAGQMDILTRVSLLENRLTNLQQVQFSDLKDGTASVVQQVQHKVDKLDSAHQQLQGKVAAMSVLPQLQARLSELENSVVELCEKVPQDNLTHIASARAAMESRARAMQELDERVAHLGDSLAKLTGKSDKHDTSMKDISQRVAELDAQVQKAQHQNLDVTKQLQDQQVLVGQVASMQTEQKQLAQRLDDISSGLQGQATSARELQSVTQGLKQQLDAATAAAVSKDAVSKVERSTQSAIKDLKAALDAIVKADHIAALEARVQQLEAVKDKQPASASGTAQDAARVEQLERTLEDLKASVSSLAKAPGALESRVSAAETLATKAQKAAEAAKAASNKAPNSEALESRIAALEKSSAAASQGPTAIAPALVSEDVTGKIQERLADLEQTVPQQQSIMGALQAQVTILEQVVHQLQSQSGEAGAAAGAGAGAAAGAGAGTGAGADNSSSGKLSRPKSSRLKRSSTAESVILTTQMQELQDTMQIIAGRIAEVEHQQHVAADAKSSTGSLLVAKPSESTEKLVAQLASVEADLAALRSGPMKDIDEIQVQLKSLQGHLNGVDTQVADNLKALDQLNTRLEQHQAATAAVSTGSQGTAGQLDALKAQLEAVAGQVSSVEKGVPGHVNALEAKLVAQLQQSKTDAAADKDQWSSKVTELTSKITALEASLHSNVQQLRDEVKQHAAVVPDAPVAAAPAPAAGADTEAVQKLSQDLEALRNSVMSKTPEGMVPREEMMRALGAVTTELSKRITELRQKVGLSPPPSASGTGSGVPSSLEAVVQILAKSQVDLKNDQQAAIDELHVLRARIDELELSGPSHGAGGDVDPLLQSKVDTAMKKVEDLSTAFMLINDGVNQRFAALEAVLQGEEPQAPRREVALPPESPSLSYGMAPAPGGGGGGGGGVRFREEYAPPPPVEVQEEYAPPPQSRAGLLPGTATVISPKNNAAALLRPKSAREKVALLVAEELNESQRREERLKNDEARIQAQRAAAAAKKTNPREDATTIAAARPYSSRITGSAGSGKVGFSEDYGGGEMYRTSANTGLGGGSGALMPPQRNASDWGAYDTGKSSLSLDGPRPRTSYGGGGGGGMGAGMGAGMGMMAMGQQMSPARMAALQQQQQSMYMNMRHQQMQAQQANSLRKL